MPAVKPSGFDKCGHLGRKLCDKSPLNMMALDIGNGNEQNKGENEYQRDYPNDFFGLCGHVLYYYALQTFAAFTAQTASLVLSL